MFLEFQSRSYGMSLHPIFLIFLGVILFFEIYLIMSISFSNSFVDLEIYKGVKGKKEIGISKKINLFLTFF